MAIPGPRRLDSSAPEFEQDFNALCDDSAQQDAELQRRVADIIDAVRRRGDEALLEFSRRFDATETATVGELEVSAAELKAALNNLEAPLREALQAAAARIRRYAEQQALQDWDIHDDDGNRMGQRVLPLDRAGLYVPGGKASYPSSVLMNAIPARVAGVGEIIMMAPAPGGVINPTVLAAAAIAGVDRVFRLGGAQAIAALAYGTKTVPAVDKIVGPGNAWVAEAKRQVFGAVGIDMVAGPSEILVICDGQTDPDWIAMDLFSQAEHDEDARALLLSPDSDYLDAVAASIARLLPGQSRAAIIEKALQQRGALIRVRDLSEAAALANRLAPEHLELSVAEPEKLLQQIRHAGAVFLGRYCPEALGDYCAGPNHVLPTARAARYASPLGVYDFQKRSSIIHVTEQGASALASIAERLASSEGLQAHAESAAMRITPGPETD